MTIHELSQLYHLNREIAADKQRLAELEAAATSTSTNITGMPRGTGISNKTAIAAAIADIRSEIEYKIERAANEYCRLLRYINSVDDSFMRQVLTYRFINGLTWNQVALSIGGGNSADSVRKACTRFLSKN